MGDPSFPESSCAQHPAGVWIAQDIISGAVFHEPSLVPYHVIFLRARDHAHLLKNIEEGTPEAAFAFAQRHYGNLPGFRFERNTLTTPDNYATARSAIAEDRFYCPK